MKIFGTSCSIFLSLLLNVACSNTDSQKPSSSTPVISSTWSDAMMKKSELSGENTITLLGLEDLIAISEVEKNANKYSLLTTTYLNPSENASRIEDTELGLIKLLNSPLTHAEDLIFPTDFKHYNSLATVGFTSDVDPNLFSFDDKSLRDLDILGEENTKYPLRLRLTENYLLVDKIATESQIATIEKTFAEVLADKSYAVVLAGFPITKYRLENKSNNVGSLQLEAIPVSKLEQADAIRIDESAVKKFQKVMQIDVFSAEIFAEGKEYNYEKSVADRPYNKEGEELPHSFELGWTWASGRVRLHRTKNSVQFIEVISSESDDIEGKVLLEIPVEWKDYRIVQTGSDAQLMQEELVDGHPAARQWNQRKWVAVEFNRADNIELVESGNLVLKRLELAEDYLGFEVFESNKLYSSNSGSFSPRVTFKYSLKEAAKIEKEDTSKEFPYSREELGFLE